MTPRARQAPRIQDVARLAGVSVGTASKALNGRAGASELTRSRVRAAAQELGFRPNAMARGLPSGRSFTVGLVTTDSFGRFTIPIMLGAEDALGAGELAVLLCDTRDDPAREARYVEMLAARHVDGIIVTGRRAAPRPPLAGDPGCPVVYAFTESSRPEDCSVLVDEAGGTRLAVEHLIERGRRRLAVITGPRSHRSARVRASAAQRAARAAGGALLVPPRFGRWEEAWGREAAAELVARVPELDGLICGSDQIARGAVDGLRGLGRAVPGDLAVVGFDNWEVMAQSSRPPLTTVDMELGRLGQTAAEMLREAIDGRPCAGRHTLPCRLVERGSTPNGLQAAGRKRSSSG
ncbi:MAG TPA: LacI family DNA-binding transcriptional regulator [Solirubrobacteraceae bacterium]|nr:LacI family DNA-binding transcriptional regulator [Solirubrobacteraceae bacterium]